MMFLKNKSCIYCSVWYNYFGDLYENEEEKTS